MADYKIRAFLGGAAAAVALGAFAAEYPTVTMREKPAEFFHLMPQAGVTHLVTEDDLHNAIWDMAVSPEGRVFFGACGETFGSVYARMYEFLPDEKRLVRHFDLEKRLALDDVGLRTSKFHTSMSFLGGHKLLTTTHTTSPSPRHPVWMPYEYYNHKFEGFKGSDLLIWDYETNETKGLGKFTSHDTIYGATYDPKTGDYFGISCLLGRGYVYNLKDGSVRRLGQVTDSRASKTFLCSDGHIYGSTFSGAMFRYNTDRRDVEYLGLHVNGLLRQAHEWNGVLYFFTGTCGRPGCGMDFYAYDLKAGTLKNLGCPVPLADRLPPYRPDELPQYHAYGMTMDGEGRLWYGCHTVTPTIRYPGVKLFMWDFLRGKKPVDCGFLGTKLRTVSELADMRWLERQNMLVVTDGNHNSDKDDACGIISIELEKFLPALADTSAPRLFSHDYTNYLPYPPNCWKYYPKDDWDACYARYLAYYRDVTQHFKQFAKDNAFRISSVGASGISVWERTGRTSSAVKAIRWTSPTAFSFWTSGEKTFRTDCSLDERGMVVEKSFGVDALPPLRPLQTPVDAKVVLPAVPGRQYLAVASASVALDDGSVLVGTKDGMLARIANGKARAEGNVMTSGPVLMLEKAYDGSVWGVSAHDEGLGYVFRWTAGDGLELKGVPPDVKAPNGRIVHIYQPSAVAVSPDGRYVAVGGRDEIAGVTVFPSK